MTPQTAEVLGEWIDRLGPDYPEDGLLFPASPDDPYTPADPEEMNRELAEVCRRAGVRPLTFDDLARYGRECREAGIDPMTGEPLR